MIRGQRSLLTSLATLAHNVPPLGGTLWRPRGRGHSREVGGGQRLSGGEPTPSGEVVVSMAPLTFIKVGTYFSNAHVG